MIPDATARRTIEASAANRSTIATSLDAAVQQAINTLRLRPAKTVVPLEPHEAAAVGVLYRRYAGMLLTVARQLTTRRQDAEDVLHDVFCRLPAIVPTYRGGDFGAWLRRVTVRTALMRLRSQRRDRATCDVDDDAARTVPLEQESAVETEQHDLIRRAVRRLPPSLRRVVVLRVVLSYSHRQIADALDITPCASEVRFCRAMKELRFAIQSEAPCGRKLSARRCIPSEAKRSNTFSRPEMR
jgi:RNA polymerase sigma-70 factor, ECF subfamily